MNIKNLFIFSLQITIISLPAQAAPSGYFDLEPTKIVSGETWEQSGSTYRLYGIQACLRNTFYTTQNNQKQDCGIASIDGFLAFVKDTNPYCAVVAKKNNVNYSMCYSTIGDNVVDLGTALVTSGYAFAALDENGMPYETAYSVAEATAAEKHNGLWQFSDVKHPSIFLSTLAREKK